MLVMQGCGPRPRAPERVEEIEPIQEIEDEAPPAPIATEENAAEVVPPAPPLACASDGDCHFDDACTPTRCVAEPALGRAACAESGPTPGACVCVSERCTLRRPGIAHAPGPCGADDASRCGYSASEGLCLPGHVDERRLEPAPSAPRPVSACGPHEGEDRCSTEWDEPVACTSERDCWWGEVNGRYRWIRRPRSLRRARFRPCVDGSSPPMCIDGFCGTDPLFAFGC